MERFSILFVFFLLWHPCYVNLFVLDTRRCVGRSVGRYASSIFIELWISGKLTATTANMSVEPLWKARPMTWLRLVLWPVHVLLTNLCPPFYLASSSRSTARQVSAIGSAFEKSLAPWNLLFRNLMLPHIEPGNKMPKQFENPRRRTVQRRLVHHNTQRRHL